MSVPSSLALTGIADGSSIVASDHRNNYAAIQTAVNGLIALATTALAYVEFTAPVTANTVAEAAAVQVVSAGAVTFDGSTVEIEFFCPGLVTGSSTTSGGVNLWDVAADQGRLFDGTVVAQPIANFPFITKRRLTPSAGSHTFNIRIWNTAANNLVAEAGAGGAGVKVPGYIKITKV